MKNVKVYIDAEKSITVQKKDIYVGNITKIYSEQPDLVQKVKGVLLFSIEDTKRNSYVISMLEVIRRIHISYPEVDVELVGEPKIVVEYNQNEKTKGDIFEWIKIAIICFILFFGTGFAIMTFHEDAAVDKVLKDIYSFFSGQSATSISFLEIGYSIGIGLGAIGFLFNFSKRKDRYMPAPIDIEIDKYSIDMATTVTNNSIKKGDIIDVT